MEQPKGYGKELDFEQTYRRLAGALKQFREKKGIRASRRFTATAVLLTQLRNGARISEALDAIAAFAETGERRPKVRVRKKKQEVFRDMVIPEEVKPSDRVVLKGCLPMSVGAIKVFSLRYFKINTHSLRYAFISYLGSKGVAPQLIARITGHSTLDMVLRYTERTHAIQVLENLFKE